MRLSRLFAPVIVLLLLGNPGEGTMKKPLLNME
jgi:hypothetical protein